MTVDPSRLRLAIHLAVGVAVPAAEGARTAALLDVPEEVLPYLMLRRGGFSGSAPIRQALAAARRDGPGRARTKRPPDRVDAVRLEAARMEVTAALKAVIDHDLQSQILQDRADEALRRLALMEGSSDEPQLRVRVVRTPHGAASGSGGPEGTEL